MSATPAGTFRAVAATGLHAVALRTDGTLVSWGADENGQMDGMPTTGTFSAVAAGNTHSVAITTEGQLVDWGSNAGHQLDGTPAGTFSAVSAGSNHSVALRTDGTLVSWGVDGHGQVSGTPTGTFFAVDAGSDHTVAIVPSPTSASCLQPPAGLVSWWPGNGNFADIMGPNNGTSAGNVTFTPGRVGQAFNFVYALDSYIALPNNPSLLPASNELTIDAWVKPDFSQEDAIDKTLSRRDGCGSGGISYQLNVVKFDPAFGGGHGGRPIGQVALVMADSSGGTNIVADSGTTVLPDDERFHHIAGTYDGSAMKVYLDGQLVGQAPRTGPIFAAASASAINHETGTCASISVTATDELDFFNRALTASEILAIFNAGSAGKCVDTPTPAGPGIMVDLLHHVALNFNSVSAAGLTTAATSDIAPSPVPAGFSVGDPPTYYNITTTATFTGPVEICIPYDPAQYTGPPHLLHYEDAQWMDVTTSDDTVGHIVCGSVNSLSPFVIAVQRPPTNKNQCKNGGWRRFDNPPFKNEGNCILFANTRK